MGDRTDAAECSDGDFARRSARLSTGRHRGEQAMTRQDTGAERGVAWQNPSSLARIRDEWSLPPSECGRVVGLAIYVAMNDINCVELKEARRDRIAERTGIALDIIDVALAEMARLCVIVGDDAEGRFVL
jgi:hypothetical protein